MSITLGQKTLELPLLQGGMGIGVSRCRLAGAVAHEGAMGVISAAQIGYDQDDFRLHPESANLRELPRQIKRAKALAFGRGMIGVNIMAVTQLYSQYVKTACEAGADAIITGAGLPPLPSPRRHGVRRFIGSHCLIGESFTGHFEVLGQKISPHSGFSGGGRPSGRGAPGVLL